MLVDPQVYNSPEFDATLPERADAARANYTAPENVPQADVLVGQQSTAGAFIQQAENRREKATIGQSMDAALDEMSPMAAYRWLSGPSFATEQGFNPGSQIPGITMQLDENSREYLMDSGSQAEFDYKLGNIDRVNRNNRMMGDNMVASFGMLALDPTYLAVDLVSAGAGHLAAAAKIGATGQRLITAGTAAGGAVGVMQVEGQSRPISTNELVLGALLNGAAAGAFYNPRVGKIEPVDPEFPSQALHDIAQPQAAAKGDDAVIATVQAEAKAANVPVFEVSRSASPKPKFKAEADGVPRTARSELGRMANDADPLLSGFAARLGSLLGDDVPMGVVAGLKRSNYNLSSRVISMREGADDWVRMHEITHAMTADRLRYGRAAPDSAIGGLTRQIEELHQTAKAAAKGKPLSKDASYFLNNADEFMAGLYSGDKSFYEFLKSVPVETGNVLNQLVDTVRKLLGIPAAEVNGLTKALGLTDELMQQPLTVKTSVQRADGTKSIYTSNMLKESPNLNEAKLFEHEDATTVKVAKGISWSLHKTLASFSPKMREAADLLVDNPLNMTGDSVVSQTRAIRADFAPHQYAYEDQLKKVMADAGFGLLQRIYKPKQALAQQGIIEKQVAMEMLGREQAQRLGRIHNSTASPEIKAMADSLDKLAVAALAEMKASGVRGAEEVAGSAGYFSRRWDLSKIEDIESRLMASGLTEKAAQARLVKTLAQSMRRANGWDDVLSGDIAKAVIDRTRRKGYFEDGAFRSHAGNENLAEIRNILEGANLRGDRLQRAMDVLAGVTDEAGKASVLKHRIDLDYKSGIVMPDGSTMVIADLIDTNLTNITERYLDTVSGRAGLARKGLEDQSAIDNLRKEALASIKGEGERGKAAKLFDDTVNAIQGRPVGDDMPAFMRASQAATRMVGLASSGLWQITEYAPAMARYGALKTLRHMFKEMPGARQLFTSISKDAGASTQLKDILTRNSSADIRMRPFVQRLEDNFEIPHSANVQLALSQAQQLVPYMNAQKFVQNHQARVMSNLVIDTLHKAAKGDVRAAHAMEQYGLKPHILVELTDDIKRGGMDTALWSEGTWAKVRGPLTKAMDDAVLRNRTGEIPAFAQFSQLGKFIFTFRSFVLGAHNKVLAGTLHRDGLAGLSLALLYQFPLAMMANLANATIQGKPIKDEKELVAKSLGQMGTFGLFSDLFGVISGEKQQFGAPGLIMIDRLYKTAGQAAQGNVSGTIDSALSATPILSIIPGIRAIGSALKE